MLSHHLCGQANPVVPTPAATDAPSVRQWVCLGFHVRSHTTQVLSMAFPRLTLMAASISGSLNPGDRLLLCVH